MVMSSAFETHVTRYLVSFGISWRIHAELRRDNINTASPSKNIIQSPYGVRKALVEYVCALAAPHISL